MMLPAMVAFMMLPYDRYLSSETELRSENDAFYDWNGTTDETWIGAFIPIQNHKA